MALMGGGSQSLKQEAATINLMLESQMTNFGGPVGVTPFVTVASLNGTSFLALVLTPDDPGKGKIKVTILSPNAKQLESKGAGNSSNLNLAVLVGGTVVGVTRFLAVVETNLPHAAGFAGRCSWTNRELGMGRILLF